MAYSVLLPSFSEMMSEATIVQWHVVEGNRVDMGQLLLTIETEKATFEVETSESGIVLKTFYSQGEVVPVGAVVAIIGKPGENWESPNPSIETSIKDTPHIMTTRSFSKTNSKIAVSPVAKRLANERGIDLSLIHGTGADGLIVREDVEKYLKVNQTVGSEVALEEIIPLVGRRKVIADRMILSRQTMADVTTVVDVDCMHIQELRETTTPYSYTAFVVCAVSRLILSHPHLNATLDGEKIILKKYANISIAVDTEQGLTTPVIKDADRLTIQEIDRKIQELSQKARGQTLSDSDLAHGTFTVSNAGVLGSLFSTPIINYPQCAVLGIGKVMKTPVVRDDQVVIRPIMFLFMTYDHRVVDGAQAVKFLISVKQLLEQPDLLVIAKGE